jgi:hypothetical protein
LECLNINKTNYLSDENEFNQRVNLTSKNSNYFTNFLRSKGTISNNIDLNDCTTMGIYWLNSSSIVHAPGSAGYLIIIQFISDHCVQIFIQYQGSEIKIRGTNAVASNNWSTWKSF